MNLSKNTQLQKAMDPQAAGTTDVNGDIIDAQNVNGGLDFGIHMGTITSTAVTSVKIQHGNAADGSDMTDIPDASLNIPDSASNKLFEIEIVNPVKRYHRMVIDRGTANAVVNGGHVRLHGTRTKPRALHSSVGGSKVVAP